MTDISSTKIESWVQTLGGKAKPLCGLTDPDIASELQHVIFCSLTFDEKVQEHIAFYALAHNASNYDSEARAATASKRALGLYNGP